MVSEFEQTVRIFYRFMDLRTLPKWLSEPHKKGNRSQVQGSTFRVKDKERHEDSKSSLQMFIFPSNCQFSFKFWIRTDETDAFLVNTHPKCSPGTRMEPWTPEPLAQTDHRHYTCEKYSLSLLKQRLGIMPRVAPGRALNPWTPTQKAFIVSLIFKFGCPDCIRDVSG